MKVKYLSVLTLIVGLSSELDLQDPVDRDTFVDLLVEYLISRPAVESSLQPPDKSFEQYAYYKPCNPLATLMEPILTLAALIPAIFGYFQVASYAFVTCSSRTAANVSTTTLTSLLVLTSTSTSFSTVTETNNTNTTGRLLERPTERLNSEKDVSSQPPPMRVLPSM